MLGQSGVCRYPSRQHNLTGTFDSRTSSSSSSSSSSSPSPSALENMKKEISIEKEKVPQSLVLQIFYD
ncbi:unnamed protein product [Rotaria sp. Silwood1]|nr:unnamed protein product [Rotaria sp. Silwood1]